MAAVPPVRGAPIAPGPSQLTPGAYGTRINWRNLTFLTLLHLLAFLALFPWFFSWTGLVLCIVGIFIFGMLGINVGYHRLLTHRGFKCPKWVERPLSILGCCCGQESPGYSVEVHRKHHNHADSHSDPHSPLHSFLWGHIGWLLSKSDELQRHPVIDRYAKDLKRDPFHAWLIKSDNFFLIAVSSWLLYYIAGFTAALIAGVSIADANQFGLSLFVWGAMVRNVLLLHTTWSVNSVAHRWGYRRYETQDDSHNNIFVGIVTNGEGWHNNHHADPRSARHGHKWWELDLSWLTIRLMMMLGLATDVAIPSSTLAKQFSRADLNSSPSAFNSTEEGPRVG